MGRSPASGWLLLRQLRRAGFRTYSFGYNVTRESFDQIVDRLASSLNSLLDEGEVVLIGHSLGGVLLRQALSNLGSQAEQHVRHLFLLGSPLHSSQMARRFSSNLLFRLATQDCGRLLASPERMAAVGVPQIPITGIAGVRGIVGVSAPFGKELNDGVVSLSEVSADWLNDQEFVSVVHTLLPTSRQVGEVIIRRLVSNEN